MAALVKQALADRSMTAFSYGYRDDDPNVVGGIQMAEMLGCQHVKVITTADEVPRLLADSIYHLEEPVGRDQYLMLFKMACRARGLVDTLITGNCGDYVFGSPPLAYKYMLASRVPVLRGVLEDIATDQYSGAGAKTLAGKVVLTWRACVTGRNTPRAAQVRSVTGYQRE
ncbi:MAG: Asparagine synthetase [glutamine-hydrolyzing] (EC [uncultured Caballeronia sp.]|nr:MAG: Asparagine synthetase [glutamine-hydrolyzing] (EC [uncultured Caballeronia sp.]